MTTPADFATVPEPLALRFERRFPGPIERVWRYLTDDVLRGQWLASGPMLLAPGGAIDLQWDNAALSAPHHPPPERFKDFNPALRGRILECEPPHLLTFTWGEDADASTVTFELTPDDDSVRFVLTHRDVAIPGILADSAAGWHSHLAILGDILGDTPVRSFWGGWAELRDAYEKLLGS